MIALGIFIGILLILGIFGAYYFKPNENLILDFIKKNPNKSAIVIVRNDTILAQRNNNNKMPLASTVKIIIAIEYAIQSASGELDPNETVPLEELEKFYIPNTDGGAHPRMVKISK